MRRVRHDNYATLDVLVAHARTYARTHAWSRTLDVNERACAHEGAVSHRVSVKIVVTICTRSGGASSHSYVHAFGWLATQKTAKNFLWCYLCMEILCKISRWYQYVVFIIMIKHDIILCVRARVCTHKINQYYESTYILKLHVYFSIKIFSIKII